jgi:TRAP-type C4-dicarboxylate transport system substrate-binding protein
VPTASRRSPAGAPRGALLCAALLAALWVAGASAADKVVVRLATVAPNGSLWHDVLKQMDAAWRQATGGRVALTIYAGGIQGDEPTVLRKIRVGQLHAAALTATGLGEIDPAFNALTIPLFFRSDDEVRHVLERLTPTLQQRLEAKGFVLLNWGHGGWAHVFSTRPISTLQDLKALKLFTSAGDDRMVQWYKRNGFHPVPLALTDILTSLQTGMIEAIPSTPLAALTFQWFKHTPYMLDLPLGPLIGATIVSRQAWQDVPEADRPKLLEAARKAEARLWADVPRQDRQAIAVMQGRGLTVSRLAGTDREAEWRKAAQELAATMRGEMVPADVFDLAARERDAFRQRTADGGRR